MGALRRVPMRQAIMFHEHPWSAYCVPGSLFTCAQREAARTHGLTENETEQLRDVSKAHIRNGRPVALESDSEVHVLSSLKMRG